MDSTADELVDALVESCFVVTTVLTRVGAEHDLSLTQMRALGVLRDRRPRMAELAKFLGLDKSTMSGLVERAERRGLLQRGPNADDRRAVDVFPTPAGRELARQVHVEVRQALATLTGSLSARERQTVQALLGRMLDSAYESKPPTLPAG